jgi:hypothetical protein
MVRRLVAAGCAAALVGTSAAAAAAVPAGPGQAAGFYTFSATGELHGTAPVADRSGGFDVWVQSGTPHAAQLADAIRYAVFQLTRSGISVRYRGVGHPPAGPGVIAVTEAASTTSAACLRRTSADSGAVTEAVAYPSFEDVGLATRIDAGEVTFCPPVWARDQNYLVAVALHEMGHAVGLGHFADRYQGAVQVMNPIVPDLQTYQAGDVNGLRYLAAETATLRAESVVTGAVDSWTVTRAGLAVTGWAIVGRTNQFAYVDVTRDGERVYRITTNAPRPDITARYHAGWPSPGFSGSEVSMADGAHEYCVIASASSSAPVTLGCRRLAYPPAVSLAPQPPLPALGKAPIAVWWSSTAVEIGLGAGAAVLLALVVLVAIRRRRP